MDECIVCGGEAVGEGFVEGAKVPLCAKCFGYGKRFQAYEEYRPAAAQRSTQAKAKEKKLVEGFGRKIREAREKQGLSTKQFAEKHFIKEGDLKAFEDERLKPPEKMAEKLEYALGVSLLETEAIESIVAQERSPSRAKEFTLADVVKIRKK